MMQLVMKIGDKHIQRIGISFEGLKTFKERQEYLELEAQSLYDKHYKRYWREEPVFYVRGVQSKANDIEVEDIIGKTA